jgi:hypothetical protein
MFSMDVEAVLVTCKVCVDSRKVVVYVCFTHLLFDSVDPPSSKEMTEINYYKEKWLSMIH